MKTSRERPKSASYLRLKNIQGTTKLEKLVNNFFQKKVFGKKSRILPKNPKRPSRLIKRFLQTENFKKFKGAFDRIQKFLEKCRRVPKKTAKGRLFGLPSTFGSIKNLWFSARLEPTLSCFSDPTKSVLTSRPRS